MDAVKGSRAILGGKTQWFPIYHYVMQHVHIPIANGEKGNSY